MGASQYSGSYTYNKCCFCFYYHTRGVHQDISNCTTAQESHSVHANTKRSLVWGDKKLYYPHKIHSWHILRISRVFNLLFAPFHLHGCYSNLWLEYRFKETFSLLIDSRSSKFIFEPCNLLLEDETRHAIIDILWKMSWISNQPFRIHYNRSSSFVHIDNWSPLCGLQRLCTAVIVYDKVKWRQARLYIN